MAVRMIKKSWWVDFRFNHTRYRRRSPANSRAGALAYEAVLRHKFARGETIDKARPDAQERQSFSTFARTWFDEYVVPNNKPSEQLAKKYILSASLIPFFGEMRIEQITGHYVERYKALMLKEGVGRKTVNNRLTVLRKCLSTAYDWLGLDGAPPKITWLKCPPPKTGYLSPDECTMLLANAEGVVREMILTALRTGMRLGELKGLQWSSIDWHNRTITVRHSRCDLTKELDSTKSNRERHIPMDIDVERMLFGRKQHTGYVFVDTAGQPFNNDRLIRRLEVECKKAGLRKIGWHALRHTFASHLAMKGVPLNMVQQLLGHSTITTTMRYAHLAPSMLRTAIDLMNPKTAHGADFGQPVGNRWLEAQQKEAAWKGAVL
jgi:integrase